MITHVVIFTLKPEFDAAGREKLFGQIKGLTKLPTVKRLTLGKLLEPSEGWYKARMATDFEWAFTVDFDDEAALYAYQKDPYHMEVGQEIRKHVTVIKVLDFVSF